MKARMVRYEEKIRKKDSNEQKILYFLTTSIFTGRHPNDSAAYSSA